MSVLAAGRGSASSALAIEYEADKASDAADEALVILGGERGQAKEKGSLG